MSLSVTLQDDMTVSNAPLSADALDEIIAGFSTVEEVLRTLNPDTWRQDLNSIYVHTQTPQYVPRSFHTRRANKRESHAHTRSLKSRESGFLV